MGPKILPFNAREQPRLAAITRSVPRKIESPIAESGPISPTLTALMDSVSKSLSFAFCSSIAAVIPNSTVQINGVILLNSK